MPSNLTSFLFAWYNQPFTVLLTACIVLAVFQRKSICGPWQSRLTLPCPSLSCVTEEGDSEIE